MKRQRLDLGKGITVEAVRDWNGIAFIAFAKDVSLYCNSAVELRRFLKLAPKTTSRETLDAWLDDVLDKAVEPAEPIAHTAVVGSFDPGAHPDDDPTAHTKMII